MSGRKLSVEFPSINAQSMASNITGSQSVINLYDNVVYHFIWSGANPIGSIVIQLSLDGINWQNYQNSPGTDFVVSPGGSAGTYMVVIKLTPAIYIRPAYTTSGGSVGTLTALFAAKMV